MSLYNYYFDCKNEEQPQQQISKSEAVPNYNCTWSFLDTPELILSDTEDGSSCGGEDLLSYACGRQERQSSAWTGTYVQFDKVSVREYIRCVGDHPACWDQYPLCIDWAHGEESFYEIDDYEAQKTRKRSRTRGRVRRPYLAKRVDEYTRKKLLETEYSVDPDLQDGCEIGVECQLEIEPELAEDRWGCNPDMDSPLDEMDYGNHFCFPSSMMKVQVLED
jgi:hypothetical protein